MQKQQISRRAFLGTSAASAFGALVVPRHVLGGPGILAPSDTVNVAAIGAGGMGAANMANLTNQNIVAFADVDFDRVAGSLRDRDGNIRDNRRELAAAYEKAARYHDWREMLDRERDIEAVVIATPDHMHAVAAKRAMEMGKHVYVQKPLTYTVEEARVLKRTADDTNVVTQMGNQGHSGDDGRRAVELIWGDVIGPVREVHSWTNRPRGYWPQGVGWPEPAQAPNNMDWELYLGPVHEMPYYPEIHPFNWRGFVDFGVGSLGDMGAHLIDFPFWALDPGMPTRIETRHSPWGGPEDNPATYPYSTTTYYEFGRGGRDPLKMTWYDGGLLPPTPKEAPADLRLNPGGGVMYMGDKGILIHDTYGRNPQLIGPGLEEAAAAVPQMLPRIPGGMDGGHEQNWIRAIRGEEEISCPFSYAADLNEVMILGVVAMRAEQPIEYDATNMRITNAPDANRYLSREYRKGWELG